MINTFFRPLCARRFVSSLIISCDVGPEIAITLPSLIERTTSTKRVWMTLPGLGVEVVIGLLSHFLIPDARGASGGGVSGERHTG